MGRWGRCGWGGASPATAPSPQGLPFPLPFLPFAPAPASALGREPSRGSGRLRGGSSQTLWLPMVGVTSSPHHPHAPWRNTCLQLLGASRGGETGCDLDLDLKDFYWAGRPPPAPGLCPCAPASTRVCTWSRRHCTSNVESLPRETRHSVHAHSHTPRQHVHTHMPTRAPHTCTHTLVPTQARPQAQTRMDTRAPRFTFGLDSSTNRRGRARGPMSVIHKWPHTCEPPHTRVPRAPADAHASPCTCVHMGPRVPWASPHLQGHPPQPAHLHTRGWAAGGGLCLAQTEGLRSVRGGVGLRGKCPWHGPEGRGSGGLAPAPESPAQPRPSPLCVLGWRRPAARLGAWAAASGQAGGS